MEDNNDEQNEAGQARVSLPQDVQQIILASLPGRVVLKFRRVCKFWRDCIEEPTFVDRHLHSALRFHQSIACFTSVDRGLFQMYTFDPTTMNFKSMELVFSCRFNMSGPCNGLVCAYDLKGGVEVLNPTTRKHLGLPVSELVSQAPFSEYFVGFVHSAKEYKVVSVRHHLQFLTFEVCTIGTLSWRTVRESADLLKTTKAVIVNDGVYWLLLDEISSDLTRKILGFNLTDEKFSTIAVPEAVKYRDLELFEGEGKLHLLSMPCKGSAYTASEIWVAGSTRQVWVHMYTLAPRLPLGMRPFFLHKRKLFFGNQKKFTYIDLVDGSVFYVDMPSGESLISCGMFVESFIPSMIGLVNSTTLPYSSHRSGSSSIGPGPSSRGAGSSFTGPGHPSGGAGWSSTELVQSSKRAKRTMNMEWKMYGKEAKFSLVYE